MYGLRGEPALPSPSPRPLSADSAHAPRADSPSPCAQNTVSHALARIRSTLALHRLGDGRPLPASTARPLARARQQPGRLAASPRPHHSTARPPGARPAARGQGVRANSARSSRSPRQPDRPGHAHPPGSRKDRIRLDMVLGHPYFVAARRSTASTERHPGALAPSPDRHHAREAELTRAFSVRSQVQHHRHASRSARRPDHPGAWSTSSCAPAPRGRPPARPARLDVPLKPSPSTRGRPLGILTVVQELCAGERASIDTVGGIARRHLALLIFLDGRSSSRRSQPMPKLLRCSPGP